MQLFPIYRFKFLLLLFTRDLIVLWNVKKLQHSKLSRKSLLIHLFLFRFEFKTPLLSSKQITRLRMFIHLSSNCIGKRTETQGISTRYNIIASYNDSDNNPDKLLIAKLITNYIIISITLMKKLKRIFVYSRNFQHSQSTNTNKN